MRGGASEVARPAMDVQDGTKRAGIEGQLMNWKAWRTLQQEAVGTESGVRKLGFGEEEMMGLREESICSLNEDQELGRGWQFFLPYCRLNWASEEERKEDVQLLKQTK